MGNSSTIAERLKAVRLFNKCQFHQHLLPKYHSAEIVREHLALKTAIGKHDFKACEWAVYLRHMTLFINALPPAPSDDAICKAIEFYRAVDRRSNLPDEFAVEDRNKIFERHDSLKELRNLSMAITRNDYASLLSYQADMYATFTAVIPPEYSK